jgi:hypothetical protein
MRTAKCLLSDEEYSITTEKKDNKVISRIILYEKDISMNNFISKLYKKTGKDLSYMYVIEDESIGKCEVEIKVTLTKD